MDLASVCAVTSEYVVFAPRGWLAPCCVVGVDVGRKHLGITGLSFINGPQELPQIHFLCLISLPPAKTHESTDRMVEIMFGGSRDFAWLRSALYFRIELQEQGATYNLMIAIALRSAFYTNCLLRGLDGNRVGYVHGAHKYKVAPLFCASALEDGLRMRWLAGDLGGKKNKPARKQLAVNDACTLLKNTEGYDAIAQFLLEMFGFAMEQPEEKGKGKDKTKVDDVFDSYLVAMWFFLENGLLVPTIPAPAKKRKRVEDLVEDFNAARERLAFLLPPPPPASPLPPPCPPPPPFPPLPCSLPPLCSPPPSPAAQSPSSSSCLESR